MSVVQVLVEENSPIADLPWCLRCGNIRATVSVDIGEQTYDLCVRCSIRPPTWSIPK